MENDGKESYKDGHQSKDLSVEYECSSNESDDMVDVTVDKAEADTISIDGFEKLITDLTIEDIWRLVFDMESQHEKDIESTLKGTIDKGHRAITQVNCKARIRLIHHYRTDNLRACGVKTCHIMGYMISQKGGYDKTESINAITSQAEKEGGGQKSATTIATFTNFIDSNELVDIGMVGHPFTWTNRRQGEDLVKERLDRYLVRMEWKLKFPNAVVHRLTESGSDHAPILMETEPQSWHSKRRFKYQKRWCGEEDVKRIVSEVWRMEVVGSAMFSLAQKLKVCRYRLVQWQQTHKANSRKEIEDLQAKLEELRVAGINGGEKVTSLEEKLELAYLKEESYWREKSRIKWLKEGDQNTRFFYQKFQSRMRRNIIWRLVGRDNEIASKPEDIAKVAEDYFCDIFTSSCSADPNPYLEDLEPKVTASMNRRLQRPVTMDEVKRATFSVHAQSAPGDDGFTAKFFHFFWDIVGGDVFKAVRSFFHSGRILKSFNHTQICLIPKVPDASDMTQSAPNTSQSILELLETYEGFSGQKVNLNKSAIFFSHNTPQNTRLAVAQTLNIEHIGAQDKYLGLPSIVQKSKKATFGAIKDKVQKRIMGWKRSILSSGGRHTLLRAVGEAIPIYTLSCFKLPDTLLTEIHSMLSQFWWGKKGAERRMVWIKWDTMTRPKKDGGLGIKDLRAQNLALLGKQCWRLMKYPNSTISRMLKAKYFRYTDFLHVEIGSVPSWGWRSVLEGRKVIEKGLLWKIGSGTNVRIFHDPWLPPPPPAYMNLDDSDIKMATYVFAPNKRSGEVLATTNKFSRTRDNFKSLISKEWVHGDVLDLVATYYANRAGKRNRMSNTLAKYLKDMLKYDWFYKYNALFRPMILDFAFVDMLETGEQAPDS
ncbi:uncharacterized protein [Arachis hypogaea]|uniref:uncharacterized protein n=1 Tax=Arachis hypogaea TaxID=3818 RepID=UPI000DEC822A|nr:uncharacterized protein LOC112721335 [Arachis hypogaea]